MKTILLLLTCAVLTGCKPPDKDGVYTVEQRDPLALPGPFVVIERVQADHVFYRITGDTNGTRVMTVQIFNHYFPVKLSNMPPAIEKP